MTKKIVILSDTHGFIHPEIKSLVDGCDIAIHAGDVLDEDVLLEINPKEKLVVVAGNNDAHISHLKDVQTVEIDNQTIVIEHGHRLGHYPSHRAFRESYPNVQMIVYGHTHEQVIDKSELPWVVNPGAAGKIRTNGGASCLTFDVVEGKEWDINSLRFVDAI